jgi:nucleoside diphosphate kinase
MSGIFVINGFYAAMRQVYTDADAKLHWFDVEWSSSDSSWEDFRGVILGATDPTTAAQGSLRREIFEQWQALGLSEEPNVGLNGVHASASPFEGLAERLNWLGADLKTDSFGSALLAAGLSEETIRAWSKDPQVDLKEGGKGSLFDQVEDQSVETCLTTLQSLAGAEAKAPVGLKNRAFVFIKPHAVNADVISLVKAKFAAVNITVLAEGDLTGPVIDQKKYIDNHYLSIATKASLNKPSALNPPAAGLATFEKTFGMTWADVQAQGRMFNAVDACALLGVDGNQLDTLWAAAKKSKKLAKLSGGFYCGRLPGLGFSQAVVCTATPSAEDAKALSEQFGTELVFTKADYARISDFTDAEMDTLWTASASKNSVAEKSSCSATKFPAYASKWLLNGFYAGMRSKFTDADAKIHWYVVEWSTASSTWENFRGSILGATDPATAEEGSLRRQIFDDWKNLGLASEPNVGDNGVHASASPFEALAEELNWLQRKVSQQPFGAALLAGGLTEAQVLDWSKDPQVDLKAGGKGSLFDQVEDQSVDDCLATLQSLAGVEAKAQDGLVNRAFVFIKPHANTPAVVAAVNAKFAASGFTVLADGELTGPVIDEKKYIDNHYLSIATKASLNKPAALNPPAAGVTKFEAEFGLSWKTALSVNVLFNAVDGATALAMTGDEVDAAWAICKKQKHLVKLSGGFYAGRIERLTW